MDVQKALAQAEQLFRRGKTQEAVEKYEEVLEADPQNEVAANKAALAYMELDQKSKAVGLYCNIARRASEKGKNQKALALYKQALAIDESDARALKGIAEESEQLGKFSDAVKYSDMLVNIYLPRKRYLEIIDACARLVRCQPENERAKQIWIEVVRVLADEGKLARALVVFCGPPGLASAEEQIGGDPSKIGQTILSQLISLQEWFPADPSLPYALAWVAYRNSHKKSAYRFLAESFRRDPDYCLSSLLLSRMLIEEEKLAEAQFVFDYAKQNLGRDHRTNVKVLMEQVESFEKANGWMAFNDGFGGVKVNAENFLRKIYGLAPVVEEEEEQKGANPFAPAVAEREIQLTPDGDGSAPETDDDFEATAMIQQPPAAPGGMELEISPSEARRGNVTAATPAARPPGAPPPPPLPKKPLATPTVANPDDMGSDVPSKLTRMNDDLLSDVLQSTAAAAASAPPPDPVDPNVEQETKTEIYSPQDMVNAARWDKAAQVEIDAQTVVLARQEKEAILAQQGKNTRMMLQQDAESRKEEVKKPGAVATIIARFKRPKLKEEDTGIFNSPPPSVPDADEQPTMIFSPREAAPVAPPAAPAPAAMEPSVESEAPTQMISRIPDLNEAGDATLIMASSTGIPLTGGTGIDLQIDRFDVQPSEVIAQAGKANEGGIELGPEPTKSSPPPKVEIFERGAENHGLISAEDFSDGEKTVRLERPSPAEKTVVIERPAPRPTSKREFAPFKPAGHVTVGFEDKDRAEEPSQLKAFTMDANEIVKRREERATEMLVPEKISAGASPLGAAAAPAPEPKDIDREDATVILKPRDKEERQPGLVDLPPGRGKAAPPAVASEADRPKIDMGTDLVAPAPSVREEPTLDPAAILAAADSYLANGEFYLARKSCREALAAGADENVVKAKLSAIRERELPESFYRQYSTDQASGKTAAKVDDIIRGLERDFDISFSEDLPDFEMQKSAKQLRPVIEEQLSGCDPKLRIDLGVAFFEMGFYEEAENQFLNASSDENARFEASYLAAQAMAARGNHRSAIEMLDALLLDGGRPEKDFLPIYYLLGESYAAIADEASAKSYFMKVSGLDRNYRSVKEKLGGGANG